MLAHQKAEELQLKCNEITQLFPKTKTLYDLADQMNRSARSGKQNIVEGWRRNTTKEYYDFLGFCIGAIAELEEDCNDIWRGVYLELIGIQGIMGEMGLKREKDKIGEMETKGMMGEMGIRGEMEEMGMKGENGMEKNGNNGSPLSPLKFFHPFDIETLKFYPLDLTLPPVVQLKLRCKELNFLLHQIQNSLLSKMDQEKTLPTKDKLRMRDSQKKNEVDEEEKLLEKFGFEKTEDGRVVKKEM